MIIANKPKLFYVLLTDKFVFESPLKKVRQSFVWGPQKKHGAPVGHHLERSSV
jgi:hypothetical protein